MPYRIKENKGRYEIIRKSDNKVVGRSTTRKKAIGSIVHRMSGEKKK
jgi:hypothetical protein